jgi:polysaccharide pyruvyl transferase WcaK-like protein
MPKGILPTVPAIKADRLPKGVVPIGRYNFAKIKKELSRTRLFLLCGGTLLQNSTSNRSLGYYGYLCDLAVKYGARVMLYAGGVGPVIGQEAVDETVYTIENCDAVTLREPDSFELLKKIGCKLDGVGVSADVALKTEPLPLPESIVNSLPEGREVFAVSVRPLRGITRGEGAHKPDEVYEMIAAAVRVISDRRNAIPLFIPLAPEDVKICQRICKRAERGIVMPRMRAGHIISLMEYCSFTLGMRLHSAVFSSVAGIPAITLAYDPKVASFARYAYHPAPLDPNDPEFNMRAIVSAAGSLYTNYTAAVQTVRARASELIRSLDGDAELAAHIYKADI